MSGETIHSQSDEAFTTKLFAIRLARRDYAMLEEMLKAAQEKVPSMQRTDDVAGAIITEACRLMREKGTLSLPEVA